MWIKNNMIKAIFNNEIKVNIFLYFITLALRLTVRTNIIMHIKKTRNHKLLFIKYVPYISVQIGNIIMQQPFFIFKHELTACILKRFFKIITRLQWYIMNNKFIQIIIFDLKNNLCQTTFQVYKSRDVGDK